MDLLNKVKNFFYEEVEVDEEELQRKEEEKRRIKEQKREEKRKAEIEKIQKAKMEKESKVEIEREVEPIKKDNISERELFKSERTFNFPMDLGDDIFDEDEDKKEKPKKEEEKPPVKESKNLFSRPSISSRYDNITREAEKKPEEKSKFRPSPVISPVYGILDKNYSVEDVKEKDMDKTKEFSLDKKIVDFDTVRNRAYKELDEEIEKTLNGTREIFYNLEDEEPTKEDNIEDYQEEEYNADEDVVITYEEGAPFTSEETEIPETEVEDTKEEKISKEENNVQEDEDDFFSEPDVSIPKIEKKEKKTKRSTKVKEVKEEKEDLFNLIDNMYNDEDEEEDE